MINGVLVFSVEPQATWTLQPDLQAIKAGEDHRNILLLLTQRGDVTLAVAALFERGIDIQTHADTSFHTCAWSCVHVSTCSLHADTAHEIAVNTTSVRQFTLPAKSRIIFIILLHYYHIYICGLEGCTISLHLFSFFIKYFAFIILSAITRQV